MAKGKKKYLPNANNKELIAKIGERLIKIVESNPKQASLLRRLERTADKRYKDFPQTWSVKDMFLEYGYCGCAIIALNGGDATIALRDYVDGIESTLKHNRYDDPVFYVPRVYNDAFHNKK